MEILTTSSPLINQLTKALGNTLIHSLWQGILLALAGGLIIIFTKKLSAALRYNLLIVAMLLFTCCTIFTFFWQLQAAQTTQLVYKGSNTANNLPVTIQAAATLITYVDKPNVTSAIISYLNANCNTIVLIWFLIICAKSIKLAVGGYEVYHLKRTKIYAVSNYWQNRIAHLSGQLKIKQAIGLVESGIAKVPMVIGHLKPLILIPVGFINALSAEEVEAILIHELAHIRRRDYLVNLLQSFMEIVFFFNPAVLWISQLIKAERENCCDNIALKQAGNKANYVQALLSCQEYQLLSPVLSMALTGNKSKLLNRVKRIVNNHNQSLNIMEKTLLTICMVTAGLLTVAFSTKKEHKNIPIKVSFAKNQQTKEHTITVDPKVGYVFKTDNKTTYKFNKTGSKITDLKVNGKAVPNSQVKKYAPQIDALLKQNEQTKQAEPNQTPAATNDTSKVPGKIYNPADFNDGTTMNVRESKNGKVTSSYLFKRDGVLYQVFMDNRKPSAIYVDGKQKPVADYQSKIDELLDEYKDVAAVAPIPPAAPVPPAPLTGKISSPSMAAIPAKPVTPAPMIASLTPLAPVSPPKAMVALTPSAALAPTPPLPMANAVPMVAPLSPLPPVKPDASFTTAVNELFKAGIIKDKENFDFNISNDALEVDGVKQPEAIHQQILKKFVKKPGDKINWHYSNHN